MRPRLPRWLLRTLTALAVVLVLAGFVWAFTDAFRDADGRVWPSPMALAIAVALTIAALVPFALAWLVMQPTKADSRRVLAGVWVAQLTKYVPTAGIAPVVAHVGLARSRSTGITRSAIAFPVWFAVMAVGNAPVIALLAFDTEQRVWVRVLAGLSVISIAVVWRPWMVWLLGHLRRVSRRIPSGDLVPRQAAILQAFGLAVLTAVLYSAGFAFVLTDLAAGVSFWFAMAAFAAALLVGIAAVPIPAGVGVRELVILFLMGAAAGPTAAASAALFHRLVIMVGELLLVAGERVSSTRAQRARSERPGLGG